MTIKRARRVAVVAATLVLAACSIKQNVVPVAVSAKQICLIENPAVRETFVAEYRTVLQRKGFEVRMLPAGASLKDCPLTGTYLARWSWDLTIYMSYVELMIYSDGVKAGEAVYDARMGGGRLDKFIDAEPKIRELVDQLFPA